ncbi:hypothetical protein [Nocardioides insulae]|uniref:hypothetical protein n=1 Tax=Nocardioides insulae TaxID=394734 RepID=UPI00048D1097|nr:hypothetical protein [Nocardioides insulae]
MAGDPDPYAQTLDAIDVRRTSLSVGAPAAGEEGGWSAGEIEAALTELDADEAALRAHWRSATQVVLDGQPERCAECGQPRDCPTAKALFLEYAD